MWRWLRDRRFSGYKFRRQYPLGNYYLDFFCEEAELNIELDGGQHGFPDQQKHDCATGEILAIARHQDSAVLEFAVCAATRKSIRDTIFEELQTRAPHPLPEYTKPVKPEKRRVSLTTVLTPALSSKERGKRSLRPGNVTRLDWPDNFSRIKKPPRYVLSLGRGNR